MTFLLEINCVNKICAKYIEDSECSNKLFNSSKIILNAGNNVFFCPLFLIIEICVLIEGKDTITNL